jgi:hypothetical protein
VARPSSDGQEVRDDMWGPSVSRARREGEGARLETSSYGGGGNSAGRHWRAGRLGRLLG